MIAKNCTRFELDKALDAVNKRYGNNIRWKRFEPQGNKIAFTITVIDCKGPGARRTPRGTRMAAACWHAHGNLFEELFKIQPLAQVYSSGSLANPRKGTWITKDGGNWQDWQVGGYPPTMMSQACDCKDRAIPISTYVGHTLVNVRCLSMATVEKCPHFIMDPDHYKADGTCLCFDGAHQDKLRKERQARTDKLLRFQRSPHT